MIPALCIISSTLTWAVSRFRTRLRSASSAVLWRNNRGDELLWIVDVHLEESGTKLSREIIVAATSSTKSKDRERNPEMLHPQGEPMVFRDESAHGRRQQNENSSSCRGEGGQCTRFAGTGESDLW